MTSALALAVVCGVNDPSTSNTEGGGRCEGRWGWSATDKEAAATSQKWQRCPKKLSVVKWERGRESFISCSQVAHLWG